MAENNLTAIWLANQKRKKIKKRKKKKKRKKEREKRRAYLVNVEL